MEVTHRLTFPKPLERGKTLAPAPHARRLASVPLAGDRSGDLRVHGRGLLGCSERTPQRPTAERREAPHASICEAGHGGWWPRCLDAAFARGPHARPGSPSRRAL